MARKRRASWRSVDRVLSIGNIPQFPRGSDKRSGISQIVGDNITVLLISRRKVDFLDSVERRKYFLIYVDKIDIRKWTARIGLNTSNMKECQYKLIWESDACSRKLRSKECMCSKKKQQFSKIIITT